MKKIIIALLVVIALCGCSKDDKKLKKPDRKIKTEKKVIVSSRKELYSYNVSYINHDDVINTYYDYKVISNNTIEKNQVSNSSDDVVLDVIENNQIPKEDEKITEEVKQDDKQEKQEENNDTLDTESSSENNNQDNDDKNKPVIDEKVNENDSLKEENSVQEAKNDDNDTKEKEVEKIKEEIKQTKTIQAKKTGYYAPNGNYLGESKVKVIDVSYYQKNVNWDAFYNSGEYYGVILRLGFYTTLDKAFERNLSELKRLNIPYGIYLFSYATTINGARKEAEFTNNMIDKYDIKPILGIYYDLESWKTNSLSTDNITKNGYNYIAKGYIESVKSHVNNNYKVGIYSGRWYAMNRLGNIAKSYVLWVAEYNSTCKYDGNYIMWQYTSKGIAPGINGYVDISYLY